MPKYRTNAFVIGVHNWGEADKLVTLFTQEKGKVRATAFGCRRPKSPLAAGMQMFQCIDAELSEGRQLDTVRQCSILKHYKKLGGDFTVMAYGAFTAELASELMPEHEPAPEVFDLLEKAFSAFEHRNPRVVALIAGYHLLEHTGMQLSYSQCVNCGREIQGNAAFCIAEGGAFCSSCAIPGSIAYTEKLRQLILAIQEFDWNDNSHIHIKKEELLQAEKILLQQLYSLLGHTLKSLAFLNDCLGKKNKSDAKGQ